jgi:hypothetical protein
VAKDFPGNSVDAARIATCIEERISFFPRSLIPTAKSFFFFSVADTGLPFFEGILHIIYTHFNKYQRIIDFTKK